ncbi:unnamed protein product [Zymoseptoria tritici ST99CH_1A5]|uniref:Enhancer of mRNA-decapping protein 3 n=1 Tax=Zymoseptoria tritici ST99CH_1A5 TaxID=1276529 RepID=A0A1Y6LEV8_ZYMTR|nr:unnamed protein product [Zymoseptoria tritici ST99CH_1A5]
MASVVGLTVWVELKHPPQTIVYGVVKALVPNSHLTLGNVFFPNTNTRWEHWDVQVTAIENLEVVPPSDVPAPPPPPASNFQQQSHPAANQQSNYNPQQDRSHQAPHQPSNPFPQQQQPIHAPIPQRIAVELPAIHHAERLRDVPPPAPTPPRQPSAFVDPAILSYGNASPTRRKSTPRAGAMETPIKSMLARAAQNLPSPGSPFIGDLGGAKVAQKLAAAKPSNMSLQQPSQKSTAPAVDANGLEDNTQDVGQLDGSSGKKKVRRGQKPKKQPDTNLESADPPPVMNAEVSRNGNDMNGSVKRGKGWRSTPLLQPSPQPGSPLDKSTTKKSRRRQRDEQEQDFAQGDTTDIQDMGDFDFESELKKFDKKSVFDEIRAGDTTADEDRLVSHNRVHRPGTYGGKNLHPTENVLSPKLEAKYNSEELDSSSDANTELDLANGRSSSKHSVSRAVFPKTKPARQNSGQHVESRPHPLTASMSSDRTRTRSTASLVNRTKQPTSLAASSPHIDRPSSPHSVVSNARIAESLAESSKPLDPYFGIRPSMTACPTLLPRALHTLEVATVATFGLTHDSVAESAARCIAEAALRLSDLHGGLRRPSRTNTVRGSMTSSAVLNPPSQDLPTIVVLAGNHDIGARALAAARQLLGRNYNIIAAESLYESADTRDAQVKTQTTVLRRMARGGANIKRGLWQKASGYIKNLTGPPAVIIDALLAGATYDSLLTPDAAHSSKLQQETREMIDWANRSRAPVLSIGCPSGVSGIDGLATTVDGEPLAVRPDRVLALGAPYTGLLKATEAGEKWEVSVADIGINIALKSDEAVSFGGSWSADLKFIDQANVAGT